jgi:molecular chaperone DnaK
VIDQVVSKGVGIDLGTTNSAVAVMNPTDTDIVIHRDERTNVQTTPSCVWKDPRTGELVVGSKAFRRIGTQPEPVRSIKRQMGKRAKVLVTDEELSPEQISAAILGEMKRQVEQDVAAWNTPSTSWVVDRAIVTVPAYFDQPSIDATRRAGEMAGLQLIELLHEPTAAASYHCWRTGTTNGLFLVYDFGGGTFDASVVRCTAGAFEVLGVSGNSHLGGDDIDTAVALYLQELLVREDYALELDPKHDPEDRIRFNQLRFLAEGVKKALSTQTEFMHSDSASLRDKEGTPVVISRLWERAEFEELIRPVVDRTIPYCAEAIEIASRRAEISLADVDQIILAGGSTHIPLVRELVRTELCAPDAGSGVGPARARCTEPMYDKVDTIVALGAAVRAAAAGGLAIYNPQRTIRVSFRGTGSTGSARARIGGKVEALDDTLDLTGGQVKLTTAEYEDDAELRDDGVFAFTNVPLQPGAENLLTFEVLDSVGNCVATAGRTVSQSADTRTIGIASKSSVLAKAFLIEVNRGGQTHLKELVPALAALPVAEEYTLFHPGDTDTVLLSMYQRQRKIQEVRVSVPSTTPRGTPIRLRVEVDELSFITVTGSIGETTFHASVEVPPDRQIPTEEEIEGLEHQFEEAIQYLPTGKRAIAQSRWRQAKKRFESAGALGDVPLAVHEYEDMEAIVVGLDRDPTVLDPPKEQFDQLVHECRQLNSYLAAEDDRPDRPHDYAELGKSIDALCDQGEKAFQASDQRSYGEAIGMLQDVRTHLVGIYQKIVDDNDPRSDAERVAELLRHANEEASQVLQRAAADGRHDVREEAESLRRQLTELERRAHDNPRGVQNKIAQLRGRLAQLMNSLTKEGPGGTEQLPWEHATEDAR